ncbi:Hypothetical protein, putative [Bodo saltans]|uniref:Uncharacterized protein n=1 Tax=Bodo saltans TaxID=75058 RepID=A0A0S4KMA0_BODSA|nr:Hypothetical protein, putative [Bodo saltans]|eukprot:CUI14725.1 Hypothetical protein, putative [Bodo saltans]
MRTTLGARLLFGRTDNPFAAAQRYRPSSDCVREFMRRSNAIKSPLAMSSGICAPRVRPSFCLVSRSRALLYRSGIEPEVMNLFA